MAFLKRSIDVANRTVQFTVEEPANSVNLKFNVDPADGLSPAYVPLTVTATVILIQENQTDKVLYSGKLPELYRLLKFAFPSANNVLPFAIGKSLILSDTKKLLITLDFDADAVLPLGFEFEINKVVEQTNNPLVIKRVTVDEELSFSTEFYPLLLLPSDVDSYETVVMSDNGTGNKIPSKIVYGKSLINSQMQIGHDFLPMVTIPDQTVTVKGKTDCFLILI